MVNATGTYQQLLGINSSAISYYVNQNWSNAEAYYTANGTPIYGWLEANATNTSTNTLLWLRLYSIPGNGTTNVSLAFWPKSSFNLSATGYLGEAPELSATYGQFDNGQEVFNFYDDFASSSLSSQWTGTGSWTYHLGAGFNLSSVAGAGNGIYSRATFTYPAVVDFYGNLYQTISATAFVSEGLGTSGCTSCFNARAVGFDAQAPSSGGPTPETALDGTYQFGSTYFSSQQYAIFTSEAISTSEAAFYVNYSGEQTLNYDIPASPLPVGLACSGNPPGSLTSDQVTKWIRERTYEAQMPTATYNVTPYPVTFQESGLPAGTTWWVNVSTGPSNSSASGNLSLYLASGNYTYTVGSADTRYESSPGSFSVDGAPVYEFITFRTVQFPVTFDEQGLPAGTQWGISVTSGPLRFSTGTTLTFNLTNGTYTFTGSSSDPDYEAPSGSFNVTGSGTNVSVPFSPLTFAIYFSESGLPAGDSWSVRILGVTAPPTTQPELPIDEPNGTYGYTVSASDDSYAAPAGMVRVAGVSASVAVTFVRVTYPVTFAETGLPPGARWWVNLTDGPSDTSTGNALNLSEPNGTYAYTISGPDRTYQTATGTFTVNGSGPDLSVAFARVTFPVTFAETGLPTGSAWAVTFDGLTRTGTGNLVFLRAVNGTSPFRVLNLSGYTASPSHGVVSVDGQAVVLVIGFSAKAATFLGLPELEGVGLVGGAVAAAAVVVTIALILRRGRRPRDPSRGDRSQRTPTRGSGTQGPNPNAPPRARSSPPRTDPSKGRSG